MFSILQIFIFAGDFFTHSSMGMTPLNILCANPDVTKDMRSNSYSKNTTAASVRNVNGMLSWHMNVVNKDTHFCMF